MEQRENQLPQNNSNIKNSPEVNFFNNPPKEYIGSTGKYTFDFFPLINNYSIVKNENNERFYLTSKAPAIQSITSLIGKYLVNKNPELSRINFPEIKLEKINNEDFALVEFFENYKELSRDPQENIEEKKFFTDKEKAFLQVYNLWIGNWDFKDEHVLYNKEGDGSIALIDFEKSFSYGNLDFVAGRSTFLNTQINPEDELNYINFIKSLDGADKNIFIKYAIDSGFEKEWAVETISRLFKKRDSIQENLDEVKEIYKTQNLQKNDY